MPPHLVNNQINSDHLYSHVRQYDNGVTIDALPSGEVSVSGRNHNPPEVLRTLLQDFNTRVSTLDQQIPPGGALSDTQRSELREIHHLERTIHQYSHQHEAELPLTLRNAAKNVNTNRHYSALQSRMQENSFSPQANPQQQLAGLERTRPVANLGSITNTDTPQRTTSGGTETRLDPQVVTARVTEETRARATGRDRITESDLWVQSRAALSLARQCQTEGRHEEAIRNFEIAQNAFNAMSRNPQSNPAWLAATASSLTNLRADLFGPRPAPLTPHIPSALARNNISEHPTTTTTAARPSTFEVRRGPGTAAGARSEATPQISTLNVDIPAPTNSTATASARPADPTPAPAPAAEPMMAARTATNTTPQNLGAERANAEALRASVDADRAVQQAMRGLGTVQIQRTPTRPVVPQVNPSDLTSLRATATAESAVSRNTNAAANLATTPSTPSAGARTIPNTRLTAEQRRELNELARMGSGGGPVGRLTSAETPVEPSTSQTFNGTAFTATGPRTARSNTLASQMRDTLNSPLTNLTRTVSTQHNIRLTVRYETANSGQYQLSVVPENSAIERSIRTALPRLPQFSGPANFPITQEVTINYGN